MASVSASDVSDANDNQNYLSVEESSVAEDVSSENLDLSSSDSNSASNSISDTSNSALGSVSSGSSSDSNSALGSVSSGSSSDSMVSASSESNLSKVIGASDDSSKVSAAKSGFLSDSSDSKSEKAATYIEKGNTKVVYGKDYSVTLKDKNGNVLSGKQIIFTFNGNSYAKTTDSNGIASLNLDAKAGSYIIDVSFAGDENHMASSDSSQVVISKAATKIASASKSAVKGKSYSVSLKDADGKALANKKVVIKFNSKTYTRTTNAQGLVSFTVTGKVGKNYKLTYKFAGDENHTASSGSLKLKVKMPTYFSGSNARLVKGSKYNVVLKDSNKKALAGKVVTVLLNGKTYKKTTNAKGIVSIKINLSPARNHLITYHYAGSSTYGESSKTVSVYVKTPTKITNSGVSVGKGKYYGLTLKDSKGNPLSKKKISIKYGTRTYKRTTNANGVAKLKINNAIGRSAKMTYKFAGNKNYGPSSGSVNVKTKMGTSIKGSSSTIVKGKYYKVTLKDGNGKAMAKKVITFSLNGKTYKKTTNKKGVASLKVNLAAGKSYKFSYKYAGTAYYNKSSSGSMKLAVKLSTTLKNGGKYVMNNSNYVVTLKGSDGKTVAGKTITFTYNGVVFKRTTDAKGKAYLFIVEDAPKTSTLSYKFSGDSKYLASSGSLKLEVKSDKVFTFDQIVAASKTLRKYVETNANLPATVSVNGVNVNITAFAYLMAKSVINVNNGQTPNVEVVPVNPSYSNNGLTSLKANIYKDAYIDMTNKLIAYVEANHALPNYIETNVGSLSPNLYTFALSKALDFYSTDSYLPSYIILDTEDVNGKPAPTKKGNLNQYKSGLNEVQSLSSSDLSKYLTASGNDAITPAIQTLANSLVAGKTSTWAKAEAIFNYVRNNIKYEYYADTRYKASGTLTYKKGNCCDHANLVVALCRAAKIPARYSHAQGCRFSSGLVAGHVWAQIYVDGIWYTADATSSRNSLGNIQNWNTGSYSSLKQYIHLPF